MKAFAEDKRNVTEKFKFDSGRIENVWEKEKMLVTSIFSFSQNVFKSLLHTCHNFFRQIWDNGLNTPRASDIFQDWCARMTHGAKYGGSFSEMTREMMRSVLI